MDGTLVAEIGHRVGKGLWSLGRLRSVLKERLLSVRSNMGMSEGIVVLIVLYE